MRIVIKIIYAIILLMQVGCVREDFSDCPDDDDSFRFYLDLLATTERDSLPLNRGDIHLFDKFDLYLGSLPITNDVYAPVVVNHIVELEEGLKAGIYKAVSWSYLATNQQEEDSPYLTNPSLWVVGQTKVDKILVNSTIYPSERGATMEHTPNIYVSSVDFESSAENAEAVLKFWQVNKEIEIDLIFRNSDGTPCEEATNNNVIITCSDKELDLFGRAKKEQPRFDYLPYEKSVDQAGRVISKFKKMTLDQTNTSPVIRVTDGNGDTISIPEDNLFTLLSGTNYPTQRSLDETNYYNIKIVILCSGAEGGGTNVTINIWVNGWEYVPITEEV